MWDLVEEKEKEEEEGEEGRAEGLLLPEEEREDEVSTGEEAVREAVMEREYIEEIGNLSNGRHAKQTRTR